jgi:hypothetical protein
VSDIHTAVVDSLKVLDPKPPIREADIAQSNQPTANREPFDQGRMVTKPNPARPINIKVYEAGNGVGVRDDASCGAKATPRIEMSEAAE